MPYLTLSTQALTASQLDPPVPGIFRTPGYPGFLALVYLLFGHSHTAVFVLQGVLDALSAVILGLIGMQLLSPRLALLASSLYACYPYAAIHCAFLHQDVLLTFAVQLVLLLTVSACRRQESVSPWVGVGLALGVVALVKAYLLLYALVPAAAIMIFLRPPRCRAQALALLCAGIVVVIAPWLARNYLVFRTFPLLAAGGIGSDLMLLVEELDAGEDTLLRKYYVPYAGGPEAVQAKERSYLQQFVDGETLLARERELRRTASQALLRRWSDYLLLTVRHIPRLWLTRHAEGQQPYVATAGQVLSWCFFVPGLVGLVRACRQWRRLLALYGTVILLTLIYAPYFAEARYTLPARPAFTLFVALAITVLWDRARRRPSRSSVVQQVEMVAAD